jgi:serine/threonine protein kinase
LEAAEIDFEDGDEADNYNQIWMKEPHYMYNTDIYSGITTDYVFLEELKGSGVVPRVLDLSLGRLYLEGHGDGFITECSRSIKEVVDIGVQMMKILKILHERGIIHGNVRFDNFIEQGGGELLIANFDYAVRAADSIDHVRNPVEGWEWFLSPWEIIEEPLSVRDDVYRAILSLAVLMNGPEYVNILEFAMSAGKSEAFDYKLYEFIFSIEGTPSPFETTEFSDIMKAQIIEYLDKILECVREMDDVQAKPNYDLIIHYLRTISALLE